MSFPKKCLYVLVDFTQYASYAVIVWFAVHFVLMRADLTGYLEQFGDTPINIFWGATYIFCLGFYLISLLLRYVDEKITPSASTL